MNYCQPPADNFLAKLSGQSPRGNDPRPHFRDFESQGYTFNVSDLLRNFEYQEFRPSLKVSGSQRYLYKLYTGGCGWQLISVISTFINCE